MKTKKVRRILAYFIGAVMLFVNLFFGIFPTVTKANGLFDPSGLILFDGTNFEDGTTWGFTAVSGAANVVADVYSGGKYLETSGSGSGTRKIEKTLANSTTKDKVLITFDWRPWDVSTSANNSEILFSDEYNNSLFRFVKKGGTNGSIGYSVGTTGTDLSKVTYVQNIDTTQKWITVHVLFDFSSETVSFEIYNKDDQSKYFSVSDLSLKNILYINKIKKISIIGNRASGQTLNFKSDIDNFYIYTSNVDAPYQSPKNITEIVSSYVYQYNFATGTQKNDVISFFPTTLNVKLENGVVVNNVPVSWSCYDYNASVEGTYIFTGTLITDGIFGVKNDNNVKGQIGVNLVKTSFQIPVIPDYEAVYYTDFGEGNIMIAPNNWGFSTQNATLAINTANIGGNSTPKLEFTQTNQSGGRVATKNFGTSIKGDAILIKLDWYPGLLNDKGTNPFENGGELRLADSSGNVFLAINNTRNSPLKITAGNNTPVVTNFSNPENWYNIEVICDVFNKQLSIKIVDKTTSTEESYNFPLGNITFDGTFKTISLVGIRTSGNNITWSTYLDNIYVYNIPVPANRIVSVDKLPYKIVYVNTITNINQIGLPATVKVNLADGSKADVAIENWESVNTWQPEKPGTYLFKGVIAQSGDIDNTYQRYATCYVYNKLPPSQTVRQTEWLNRGLIALKAENGIFISWRLLIDEYKKDIKFNIYRNGQKLNATPLSVTNYLDINGQAGDIYKVETLLNGNKIEESQTKALSVDYISIPLQKPADGVNEAGETYTYKAGDCSVGDLNGDGEYEVVVKWDPSNAIDSSQTGLTGPAIFDAYKLDGTLLWRINMGLNLTAGAHYNQFLVYDFDGDGRSEFVVKTADGTTVYGATYGQFDGNKVISVIGDPSKNGAYRYGPGQAFPGKVWGGPEYISIFDGETGKVLDSIDYRFSIEKTGVDSWGDSWFNRSDRFLATVAYLNGTTPSIVFGRGYYARTTFVAYDFVNGKLQERWYFDTKEIAGRGEGMGNHNLSVADVDNDGCDEIIAGSLTLDHDGTILYVMDGEMGRELGSHGDALHVGAFDPDREGIQVFGVHEVSSVASLEYHDGATGETLMSYYAYKDTGRGVAANITSHPGYEFWGAGDTTDVNKGAGIYNVKGKIISNNSRTAGLPMNFALYWDGDLLHELLDDVNIYKYDENRDMTDIIKTFEGVVSNNGTKATPCLQADILGDWREEVMLATTDSSELRIYSTTIPTQYRIYTLMHDPVYRLGIAWQNVAYNQPPHISFYLGEDVEEAVLAGNLPVKDIYYTNKPKKVNDAEEKLVYKSTNTQKVELYFENSKVKMTIENNQEIIGGKLSVRRYAYELSRLLPQNKANACIFLELQRSINLYGIPIRVEIEYDPQLKDRMDISTLRLYKYNEVNKEWEVVPNQSNDIVNKTIVAVLNQFSVYGVFAEPPVTQTNSGTSTTASSQSTSQNQQQPSQQQNQQTWSSQQANNQQNSQNNQAANNPNVVISKVEKEKSTALKIGNEINVAVPSKGIYGQDAVIKVEKVEESAKNIGVGIAAGPSVNIAVENGTIVRPLKVEIKVTPESFQGNKVPIAFEYDATKNKWIPIPSIKKVTTVEVSVNKPGIVVVKAVKLSDVFKDINENNWAYNTFAKAISNGLIVGYEDFTLKPTKQVTMAETAAIIQRAFGLESTKETDLAKTSQWAAEAIQSMIDNKLISENENPNKVINRLEAASTIVKILEMKGLKVEPNSVEYTDMINQNSSDVEYIAKANKLGIIKGYPDNTFKPEKPVTRAELITMILRALDSLRNNIK